MKVAPCAPLVAPYAQLSPEDKDQSPEYQVLKASYARAWSSDELRVATPMDIDYTPRDIDYMPRDIAYLLTAFCAVMEAFNGRGMVYRAMMMFMDMTTAFVSFITVVSTKMTDCTADSMMTPCDTRRGCNFTSTVKGTSSNNGMAKCKVSRILQSAWLNSLEEC